MSRRRPSGDPRYAGRNAITALVVAVVSLTGCADEPIPSQTLAHMQACSKIADRMSTGGPDYWRAYASTGCTKFSEDDWRRYERQRLDEISEPVKASWKNDPKTRP